MVWLNKIWVQQYIKTHVNMFPVLPSPWLVIELIKKIHGPVCTQVLLLREPSAYRCKSFITNPLLHYLPQILEFNFNLVSSTKLHAFKVDCQNLAAKLESRYFLKCQSRVYFVYKVVLTEMLLVCCDVDCASFTCHSVCEGQ